MSVIGSNILAGASGQGGYFLTNSLRFRSSASAYLNRTPSSTSNRQIFTWSSWIKLGLIPFSANGYIFSSRQAAADNFGINITTGSAIQIDGAVSSTSLQLTTTAVYRDPSSWYHVVLTVDTTQTTSSNRIKLYVNGVQVTAFSTATYPAQNSNLAVNLNTAPHTIGGYNGANNLYDGYLTEVYFIDGQALTPSSFGETSTTTGVWIPKKYTGTYGTNGFYLPFTNTASTSTLGNDFSGNSNTWTVNNISLTAGSTYDSMTDVPTLTSATAANYCTMNPVFAALGTANLSALSYANLRITGTSADNSGGSIGTLSSTTGKFYYEFTMTGVDASGYCIVGACDVVQLAALTPYNNIGYGSKSYGYNSSGIKTNNNGTASYGSSYTTGDVIGVAVDCDNGAIYFSKNNTWQASGDPTSGSSKTGAAYTWTGGSQDMIPQMDVYRTGTIVDLNCGQRPFAYTPPTGFVALNTFNLPTPTIGATASTTANKYMDATLYTGNGSTQSITNSGSMQPDLVWIKVRSNALSHCITDAVRGTNLQLASNSTGADQSTTDGITAFNSNGFSLGAGTQQYSSNTNTYTYVAWQWKANGSGSTNTAGSITSTVSANTSAGFSIVTYTGTGANATVGHGLGVAPSMVILKRRDAAAYNWMVWQSALTGLQFLNLDTTGAVGSNAAIWNSTIPTSTLFSLGTNSNLNANGGTYVAYCFAQVAGYSAFGSYTGNGSTDGTFVYTGFRPRFIMYKRTDTTGSWVMIDAARGPYNVINPYLLAEGSGAEDSANIILDFLSNGFKQRNTFGSSNASGGTYIYMAFAESPFRYANAR